MIDLNVLEAEQEAKRFLKRVKDYKESDSFSRVGLAGICSWYPCSERAAVKRSSMDLTKALAKMRNK